MCILDTHSTDSAGATLELKQITALGRGQVALGSLEFPTQ